MSGDVLRILLVEVFARFLHLVSACHNLIVMKGEVICECHSLSDFGEVSKNRVFSFDGTLKLEYERLI